MLPGFLSPSDSDWFLFPRDVDNDMLVVIVSIFSSLLDAGVDGEFSVKYFSQLFILNYFPKIYLLLSLCSGELLAGEYD